MILTFVNLQLRFKFELGFVLCDCLVVVSITVVLHSFMFAIQGPKFTKVDVNLALSAYANARR